MHDPKHVLVTGGAGFIGSNFLLRMVRRHPRVRFINLDKLTYAGNLLNLREIENEPNYVFVEGDIVDATLVSRLFDEYGIDSVIHFAAESHVDRSIMAPLEFVRTNVDGTAVLLEAARAHWTGDRAGRFVHVSTDEVFGSLGTDGFFTESTPYDPRSPYSASKAASDHLVRAYGHTYGLPVIITNCSNNYGPYQFPEKLIPLVISRAVAGEAVPVYGRGDNVRDWLYVDDHCDAIDLVLHRGEKFGTYVIGGDAERQNIDLVRQILDIVDARLGRPDGTSRALITFVKDRPGHDFRYAMDPTRIREEIGWKPQYSLEEGLKLTVDWYLQNEAWLSSVMDESYRSYYNRQYLQR